MSERWRHPIEVVYPTADFTTVEADAERLKIAAEDVRRHRELVGGVYEANDVARRFLLQAQKRHVEACKDRCARCGHLADGHIHSRQPE